MVQLGAVQAQSEQQSWCEIGVVSGLSMFAFHSITSHRRFRHFGTKLRRFAHRRFGVYSFINLSVFNDYPSIISILVNPTAPADTAVGPLDDEAPTFTVEVPQTRINTGSNAYTVSKKMQNFVSQPPRSPLSIQRPTMTYLIVPIGDTPHSEQGTE